MRKKKIEASAEKAESKHEEWNKIRTELHAKLDELASATDLEEQLEIALAVGDAEDAKIEASAEKAESKHEEWNKIRTELHAKLGQAAQEYEVAKAKLRALRSMHKEFVTRGL